MIPQVFLITLMTLTVGLTHDVVVNGGMGNLMGTLMGIIIHHVAYRCGVVLCGDG